MINILRKIIELKNVKKLLINIKNNEISIILFIYKSYFYLILKKLYKIFLPKAFFITDKI